MDLGCFLGCSPFLSDKPKQDQLLRLHDLVLSVHPGLFLLGSIAAKNPMFSRDFQQPLH